MAHTIVGKLNKPARVFQAGEYTGFGVNVGVQYYDRQTKQKEWTNYKAAIFTKSQQQIAFYQQSLVEGAVIELSAAKQKIDSFEGQNGAVVTIELVDAELGYVHAGSQPAQQSQQFQQPAQQYQQPQQFQSQNGNDNGWPQ